MQHMINHHGDYMYKDELANPRKRIEDTAERNRLYGQTRRRDSRQRHRDDEAGFRSPPGSPTPHRKICLCGLNKLAELFVTLADTEVENVEDKTKFSSI